jgi:uncharacterized membrane-anchored protein
MEGRSVRNALPNHEQAALGTAMNETQRFALSKVPEVTLGFWIIKILATTLGETGGDAVTMSMNLGYAVGSIVFFGVFLIAVAGQVRESKFDPYLYWVTIVATTTVGTTMADFADRSLGIGYAGGSSILLMALVASLALWRWAEGTISVNTVSTPRIEAFYWVTILFSQTLGTALGDWMADTNGLGFGGGALVFGTALVLVAALYCFTNVSRVALFWAAFIVTRPLGATLGDLLDKPHAHGGLALNRYYASAVLVAAMLSLIVVLPQRAGGHPKAATMSS